MNPIDIYIVFMHPMKYLSIPTMNAQTPGFMTRAELVCYSSINSDVNLYWVPGMWFIHLLRKAKNHGRIRDNQGLKLITEEFLEFRSSCRVLWCYDWVSIPLVYTQVVTLATYSFFIACLFGRQYIGDGTNDFPANIYFPLWTVLQFIFYMGLLKVAEQMINPYGHDDEDFDLNFLIDRHMKVINLGTDTLWDSYPSVTEDKMCERPSNDPQNRKHSAAKHKLSRTLNGLCFVENEDMIPAIQKNTEEVLASPGLDNASFSQPINKY